MYCILSLTHTDNRLDFERVNLLFPGKYLSTTRDGGHTELMERGYLPDLSKRFTFRMVNERSGLSKIIVSQGH